MLSILIPTYNFDITILVKTLYQQCNASGMPFEILCFDDKSDAAFKVKNKAIANLDKVNYQELSKNIGRAKIRNELGKAAQYPYLLFMDCDSAVTTNYYIQKYINHLSPATLLYGGRVYKNTPPDDYEKRLHYYHGKNREEMPPKERKAKPYHSFMTNNFLIPKNLFLNLLFEETIVGYGHEDTLFGQALQKAQITIKHLDNPLKHLGLEDQTTFLKKQKEAINNLYQLYQNEGFKATKLLKTYVWCQKWKIIPIVYLVLKMLYPTILTKLKERQPNLFFLDLYKLYQLIAVSEEKK